jgi:putative addiction module killer protein
MLGLNLLEVQEYIDESGQSPFGKWFIRLTRRNVQAAAKITAVLEKIAIGNISKVKSVGEGVLEYKLDWGPGYRVYFGRDGEKLVILLGGGTKKTQAADIKTAKRCWSDYQRRKKTGEK